MDLTSESRGGCSTRILNWLQKIDRYGAKPRILYDGRESFKTRFGGLITLVEVLSKVVCVGFLILQFTIRESSETNINTLFKKDPTGFHLTKETLPFAFGLQFRNASHFIDESVYKATVNHVTMRKVMSHGELLTEKTTTPLELITCDQANLDTEFFQNIETSKMFCLKDLVSNSRNIQITGVFESDFYGYLDIQINRCTGASCKPEEEVEAILDSSYFAINYVNFAIKSSNFTSPFEKYPTSYYTSTSTQYTKYIQMRMTSQEIRTDSSILGLGFFKTEKFTSTDQFYNDLAKINSNNGTSTSKMLSVLVRMNQTLIVTSRSYKSLFQFIAELGGIFQVVGLVAFFLTYRYAASNLVLDVYRYFSQCDVSTLRSQRNKDTTPKIGRSVTVNPIDQPTRFSKKPNNLIQKNKRKLLKKSGEGARHNQLKPTLAAGLNPPKDPVGYLSSLLLSKKTDQGGAALFSEENDPNMDRSSVCRELSKPVRLKTELPKTLPKVQPSATQLQLQAKLERHHSPPFGNSPGHIGSKGKLLEKKATVSTRVQELNRLGSIDVIDTVTLFGQETMKIKEKFIHLVGTTEYREKRKRFYFFDGKPCRRDFSTCSLLAQSYAPCLLPKKSPLKRIIESSENEILIDLDYLTMIQMFRDVQKLKNLLLSPDQRALFDYYHVSTDRLDLRRAKQTAQDLRETQQQSSEKKRIEILDALRAIKAKKLVEGADREMLSCLGYLLNEED